MSSSSPFRESLDAAAALARAGVPFVVIGSAALLLQGEALRRPPHDVDLVVLDDALARAAALLAAHGWSLAVWGEPLAVPFDRARVDGRHYVRATKGASQLDLMFLPLIERLLPLLDAPVAVDGLRVARAEAIRQAWRDRARP